MGGVVKIEYDEDGQAYTVYLSRDDVRRALAEDFQFSRRRHRPRPVWIEFMADSGTLVRSEGLQRFTEDEGYAIEGAARDFAAREMRETGVERDVVSRIERGE